MKELTQAIEECAAEHDFSGVVSVYRDNETIYSRGFGFADVKNKVENRIDTRFGLASGTKLLTALGIGRLIDSGVLSFHTRVKDIDHRLTGFIDPDATILNLLTHTSGIYDYLDEESIADFEDYHLEIPWFKLQTPTDYLPLFEGRSARSEANKGFSYSNGGYVVLGMIIEWKSSRLYRDFIQTEVLTPAMMESSGFFALNDLPGNTANGYLRDGQTTNIYCIPIRGGGDGGIYSTSDDLHRMWQSLISAQILSPDLTRKFLKAKVNLGGSVGYGCGLYTDEANSVYGIVGGDSGVGMDSRFYAKTSSVINILSNKTDGEERMREAISQALLDI